MAAASYTAEEEAPVVAHKFPRTPHIANLGAATRDDLVMDAAGAGAMLAHDLICEVKADGANLGVAFDRHGVARLQKRGRWVTPASESQLAKLAIWLDHHGSLLYRVLGTQHVVFGEWLAARQDVAYDHLLACFLAFDVLHIPSGVFLSCAARDSMLRGTGVPVVRPLCPPRRFSSVAQLEQLLLASRLSHPSTPGGGRALEGLYIRAVAPDGRLLARAKLVHGSYRQAPSSALLHPVPTWNVEVDRHPHLQSQ